MCWLRIVSGHVFSKLVRGCVHCSYSEDPYTSVAGGCPGLFCSSCSCCSIKFKQFGRFCELVCFWSCQVLCFPQLQKCFSDRVSFSLLIYSFCPVVSLFWVYLFYYVFSDRGTLPHSVFRPGQPLPPPAFRGPSRPWLQNTSPT